MTKVASKPCCTSNLILECAPSFLLATYRLRRAGCVLDAWVLLEMPGPYGITPPFESPVKEP